MITTLAIVVFTILIIAIVTLIIVNVANYDYAKDLEIELESIPGYQPRHVKASIYNEIKSKEM